MKATVYDPRPCELGEGPLWHPERQQFFWFDILQNKLLTRENGAPREWQFTENVSAAGWTGRDSLLIASETRLFEFNLKTGAETHICALEADDPGSRSNDGRADPQGGFWIGTMAKRGNHRPGAIYRYYRGELRMLYGNIAIPNSICFSPDGTRAFYTDTAAARIMMQRLGDNGWPDGAPETFLDLRAQGLNPDGSVTDSQGNLWNAQWGAGRVAVYATDGTLQHTIAIPGINSSCPAFGGPDLTTLFCTTARQDLSPETIAAHPENGQTFMAETDSKGWPEPRVIL